VKLGSQVITINGGNLWPGCCLHIQACMGPSSTCATKSCVQQETSMQCHSVNMQLATKLCAMHRKPNGKGTQCVVVSQT